MSLKLANLIGILVVGLHQGQRTYAPRHQAGHMTATDQTVQRKKSACHEAVHICLIGADAGHTITAGLSLVGSAWGGVTACTKLTCPTARRRRQSRPRLRGTGRKEPLRWTASRPR